MDIYKEIRRLEKRGVFIHYQIEHYTNGSNCNFAIEFVKKGKVIYRTGLWGDNHEFGDAADAMVASIKIAQWYLRDNNLKKYLYYDKGGETITKKGRKRFRDGLKFQTSFDKMVEHLYKK